MRRRSCFRAIAPRDRPREPACGPVHRPVGREDDELTSRASAGTARHFERGGYAYVPGVFQYSAGVAALPGRRIERIRFSAVKPLEEGFSSIASALAARGLDRSALCACELRSPGQFSEDEIGRAHV